MKTLIAIALAAMLGGPLAVSAQTTGKSDPPPATANPGGAAPGTPAASPQYGQGGSPHCDKMSGEERAQCLKDEGAKTESKAAESPASGATAPSSSSSDREPPKK